MSRAHSNNILVMQSGGCTPVLNRSLAAVVREASAHGELGRAYGARGGLEGLLSGKLVDLSGRSKAEWDRIARSPGAALGSTRRKLRPEDTPQIIDMLSRYDIGYMFIIGGNDSAETGHSISLESVAAGYDLTVVNIPKTIDNDLVLTDHSPGYGSTARFVALATMGAGRDAEAMGQASPITIIEVMGRDAGWLAASAALARQEERDAPHLICMPETPVVESEFVDRMAEAYGRFGFAVAVMSENTRAPDGRLGAQADPWYVDDFGHPYYDGPARHMAGLVSRRLGVRVRYEVPGTIQRSMITCVSQADVREADIVGRAGVRYALDGHTDKVVTLVREQADRYFCTTGMAPLEQVAGKVKSMPSEFLDPSGYGVTPEFLDYVRPLVGSALPRLGRLR